MSFREKSAWGMALVMLVTGIFYLKAVAATPMAPVLGAFLPYVILVTILSIAVQVVIALTGLTAAQARADEREQLVIAKAGQRAGLVLATLVVCAAGLFIANANGNLFFHLVIGALIVAQLVEYGLHIFYLRRSI